MATPADEVIPAAWCKFNVGEVANTRLEWSVGCDTVTTVDSVAIKDKSWAHVIGDHAPEELAELRAHIKTVYKMSPTPDFLPYMCFCLVVVAVICSGLAAIPGVGPLVHIPWAFLSIPFAIYVLSNSSDEYEIGRGEHIWRLSEQWRQAMLIHLTDVVIPMLGDAYPDYTFTLLRKMGISEGRLVPRDMGSEPRKEGKYIIGPILWTIFITSKGRAYELDPEDTLIATTHEQMAATLAQVAVVVHGDAPPPAYEPSAPAYDDFVAEGPDSAVEVEGGSSQVFDLDAFFRETVGLDDLLEAQNLVSLFREQGLTDMKSIRMVDNDDLKEIGVNKMGHRKLILAAISMSPATLC